MNPGALFPPLFTTYHVKERWYDSLHPYQIINALESEAQVGQPSKVVLSTVSVAAGISRDKSALDLIPLLLPKASNGLQLETLLKKHPFVLWDSKHIFCSEKRKAAQAVENYFKVSMDLSDLVEMLSTDVLSLQVYEKLNAILASQRPQSEPETSHAAMGWDFLRRESKGVAGSKKSTICRFWFWK